MKRHVGALARVIIDGVAVQHRGEHLDEKRQRRAAVAERSAERLDGAFRHAVEHIRIACRLAFGVAEIALRRLRLAIAHDADDAFRRDGGGEIGHDRRLALDRPADGDRIGRDASVAPAEGGNPMPGGRAVADREPHEPGLGQRLRVGADPAGMAEVIAVDHRDARRARYRDQRLDHQHPDDLSEPALPVDAEARGGVLHHHRLGVRIDDLRLDLGKILWNAHHAVRMKSHGA